MMNSYLVEQNSETRRAAMIAAAATDSPAFSLSRAIARFLITPVVLVRPAPAARRRPASPAPTTRRV